MGNQGTGHVYAHKYKDDGENCSPIYRNSLCMDELKESLYEDCQTLRDLLKRSFKLHAKSKCFGKINVKTNEQGVEERTISHLDYAEVLELSLIHI